MGAGEVAQHTDTVLQEIRRTGFEEAYGGRQAQRLMQEEAARLPGGV